MFLLLESKEEIARAQRTLEATIRKDFAKKVVKNIGYPGGREDNAEIYTDGHYWFWSKEHDSSDLPNPRRLNWFGLYQDDASLHISVEINTPYKERNRQSAGFFARENKSGSIYLFHSGRVGGGKKGIGKDTFLAWSDQLLTEVVGSSGGVRDGVLVMPIQGIAATRPAIRYIDTIVRFKLAVRTGKTDTREFQHKRKAIKDFYSEAHGRRKGKISGNIDYLSRHGEVVDALYAWRASRPLPKAAQLVKNVLIDLGVSKGKALLEIYEVKTSTVRSEIYTALGQLMVHGNTNDCKRVMVLPHKEPIAADLAEALQRLSIQLLKFKLDAKKATIVP